MTSFLPKCFRCKHFAWASNKPGGYVCKAFPKSIPDDILFMEFDHTKPHPDQDNDIVFEEIDNTKE